MTERNAWLRQVLDIADERGFMVTAVGMDLPGFVEVTDKQGERIRIDSQYGLSIQDYLRQLGAVESKVSSDG